MNMEIVDTLLKDVTLPRMARVRQIFDDRAIADVAAEIRARFRQEAVLSRIKPGSRVAIGVGSRGMAELVVLVRTLVEELQRCSAKPFVVPSMGSHGGATAEGQAKVLHSLGVTEASVGCPIISSMETVELGRLENGLPVLVDRLAMEADGIIVVNRVKAHTSFSGPCESGLVKMITIGLGKQAGADSCHAHGFGEMAANIVEMARIKLARAPFLFGLATVENAYDKICRVELVPPESLIEDEMVLLEESKRRMPSILFNPLDVLIVDRQGKNFSGTGTDPNITGRASTPYLEVRQQVARMAVLDLSEQSHGNATGMGFADITTRRLFDKIDFGATYANHITSTVLSHGRIPVIMETDLRAVQLAVKTCNVTDLSRLRMVRIPNTLQLEFIEVSEGLLDEAKNNPAIEVCGALHDWGFDLAGGLVDLGRSGR